MIQQTDMSAAQSQFRQQISTWVKADQRPKAYRSTDSSPAGHQSSDLLSRQRMDLISPLNRTQPLTSFPSNPWYPHVVAMVTVKWVLVVFGALQEAGAAVNIMGVDKNLYKPSCSV